MRSLLWTITNFWPPNARRTVMIRHKLAQMFQSDRDACWDRWSLDVLRLCGSMSPPAGLTRERTLKINMSFQTIIDVVHTIIDDMSST